MSIFKKTIASFGVGSAKVNTKITNTIVRQGEILHGNIVVMGEIRNKRMKRLCFNS